jgi:hypothetical protein
MILATGGALARHVLRGRVAERAIGRMFHDAGAAIETRAQEEGY